MTGETIERLYGEELRRGSCLADLVGYARLTEESICEALDVARQRPVTPPTADSRADSKAPRG